MSISIRTTSTSAGSISVTSISSGPVSTGANGTAMHARLITLARAGGLMQPLPVEADGHARPAVAMDAICQERDAQSDVIRGATAGRAVVPAAIDPAVDLTSRNQTRPAMPGGLVDGTVGGRLGVPQTSYRWQKQRSGEVCGGACDGSSRRTQTHLWCFRRSTPTGRSNQNC